MTPKAKKNRRRPALLESDAPRLTIQASSQLGCWSSFGGQPTKFVKLEGVYGCWMEVLLFYNKCILQKPTIKDLPLPQDPNLQDLIGQFEDVSTILMMFTNATSKMQLSNSFNSGCLETQPSKSALVEPRNHLRMLQNFLPGSSKTPLTS